MFAVMALLDRRQRYAIDKMSRLVLRESDNMADTSPDDELDKEILRPVEMGGVVHSHDKVDKRIIEAYKARKADEIDERKTPRPQVICGFRLSMPPKPKPKKSLQMP